MTYFYLAIYNRLWPQIETLRSEGKIDGANPTLAALTGNIVVRLPSKRWLIKATNGDACTLEFDYALIGGVDLNLTAAESNRGYGLPPPSC